jgi:hypothetical protein
MAASCSFPGLCLFPIFGFSDFLKTDKDIIPAFQNIFSRRSETKAILLVKAAGTETSYRFHPVFQEQLDYHQRRGAVSWSPESRRLCPGPFNSLAENIVTFGSGLPRDSGRYSDFRDLPEPGLIIPSSAWSWSISRHSP